MEFYDEKENGVKNTEEEKDNKEIQYKVITIIIEIIAII